MKAIWYNGLTVPLSEQDRCCYDRAMLNAILFFGMIVCIGAGAATGSGLLIIGIMMYFCGICDACCCKTIKYVANIEQSKNAAGIVNALRLTRPDVKWSI